MSWLTCDEIIIKEILIRIKLELEKIEKRIFFLENGI